MIIHALVFLCGYLLSFLLDRHLEFEWLDQMADVCWPLKETAKLLQSVCPILHSYQQCMRVLVSSYCGQHLVCQFFSILAIRTCVQWYLLHAICISLMTNDVYLFMSLFAIFSSKMSAWILCLFCKNLFLSVEFWDFKIVYWIYLTVCYVLVCYQIYDLQIFSPSLWLLSFHFLNRSLEKQNF